MDAATDRLLASHIRRLGGYPFRRNDFTPDEWLALGVIAQEYERSERDLSAGRHPLALSVETKTTKAAATPGPSKSWVE